MNFQLNQLSGDEKDQWGAISCLLTLQCPHALLRSKSSSTVTLTRASFITVPINIIPLSLYVGRVFARELAALYSSNCSWKHSFTGKPWKSRLAGDISRENFLYL